MARSDWISENFNAKEAPSKKKNDFGVDFFEWVSPNIKKPRREVEDRRRIATQGSQIPHSDIQMARLSDLEKAYI